MKNTILYLVISILFAFTSCTEKIDFEVENGDNDKLVIDGSISNETKQHKVKLTLSTDYFANKAVPRVSNANVRILEYNQNNKLEREIILEESENEKGNYLTPETSGKPNFSYNLDIILEDGNHYFSEKYTMLEPLHADSIQCIYKKEQNPFNKEEGYFVYFYGQEPATPNEAYYWDLYIDDRLDSDTITEKTYVTDQYVNGNYIDASMYWINIEDVNPENTSIKLVTHRIPMEYHDFLFAFSMEAQQNGGMFSGNPANIPTNITCEQGEKAFGFFHVESNSEVSTNQFLMSRN